MAIRRTSSGGRSLVYFTALGFGLAPDSPVCNEICGEVRTTAELPDPPDGCDFIQVRNVRGNEANSQLYEYHDGHGWHYHVQVFLVSDGGRWLTASYNTIDNWSVWINGLKYEGGGLVTFDTGVTEVNITYSSDSGCSWIIEPFII